MNDDMLVKISELVQQEQDNAAVKWGKITNSDHESYAVMLEEYEECLEELQDIKDFMSDFWGTIRQDCKEPEKMWALKKLSKSCYNLIMEAIQLAGCTEKAMNSICERGVI